jgi:NAD(P)-dependent dehydrogenase (short-subunit alcohol dehydrogenase family)
VGKLTLKVALVTGGASGLGKAIAQRLAAEGAKVVITDVQVPLGEATAAEFGCDFLTQDVTDEAQWSQIICEIQQRHGGLQILVNNAGITGPMDAVSPEDTRLADWRRIFAVNVEGVFLGCRAAIPAMHASGGGSIINMASIAGLLATPYGTAYGASKAVVRQLTKSVAQHCVERRMKIRCNSVHPGNVRTPLWDKQAAENAHRRGVSFETIVKESQAVIPMGDFTQPQDVAAAVAFLASEDSRHMTGAKLIVDGGFIHCDTYELHKAKVG